MVTTADLPITVRAYAADGVTLMCEFPYFTSLSVLDTINNVGSFQWTWNLNSPGASNLLQDEALQIAVMLDARNGSGFQEVWRGLYEQDNYDPSLSYQTQVTAQGRSLVALLAGGSVYPQAGLGSTTTSWSFTDESPGGIMEILLTAAQGRGCFPNLAWSFTSGQDSSGAAWNEGFTNSFSAGTDLMSLVVSLAQGGLCDFNMTGSTLNMYNPNTVLATDRSSSVFLRRSRDIVSMPQSRDRTQIATAALAIGDNGLNIEVRSGTYGSLGRYETSFQQSGVTDSGTLSYLATQSLAAVDDQLISFVPVYVVDTALGGPVPWVSYHAGDYISLDVAGSGVKYRATQLAIQCGPGGPTFVEPTLNDVFYTQEILVQNSFSNLSGGIVSTVGLSGNPTPGPNPTVPDAPAFVTASVFTAAYFSPATGTTMAQMELAWTTPTNTDGTTMIDGEYYVIQYRISTTPIYPLAWSELQGKPWSSAQGNPWSNPLATPQNTSWTTVQVGIDSNNCTIQGLVCGETYQFQIACSDVSGNTSAFSGVSTFVTATDNQPPAEPDAPTVFASMVAVQVYSDLGSAAGGTFNLASDLDHLEVHYSYDPSFTPIPGVGSATYLGKLIANAGMMAALIPAVGTFNVTSTTGIYIKLIAVDSSGNTSPPSPGSGVTSVLIDDSHISSLSVSKLIAGTIEATIILGGTIETASSGQRVAMDMNGIHSYDTLGNVVFDLNIASTSVTLAQINEGNKIIIDCSGLYPTIRMYDVAGMNNGFISAVSFNGNTASVAITSGTYANGAQTYADQLTVGGAGGLFGNGGSQLRVMDNTQNTDGGVLGLGYQNSLFGLFPEGSMHGGQFLYNYSATYTECQYEIDGYRINNGAIAVQPQEAIVGGSTGGISDTFSGISIGYGATMYSAATTICSYSCGTTTSTPAQNVNSESVTGFGFQLSALPPAAWTVNWWAFRNR
jgi:hypothetical protein